MDGVATDKLVSIIVPALNEAENLPLLLPRIAEALGSRPYEVLIVDDNSKDQTPAVCAELAKTYPLKLLVRTEPRNGLSGAVLYGMSNATGEMLVVMDADLQHPPERVPALLEVLDSGSGDFALGSRYVDGGSTEGGWGLGRRINSRVATLLAKPFAGNVRDPMSGFFAMRRSSYLKARDLSPLGYKIALELICKCELKRVREVPIHFGLRQKGQSKLSLKEQFRYLEHLSRLYDFTFPRLSPWLKFLVATACAWLVGWFAYLCLLIPVGAVKALAAAYPCSVAAMAVFHMRYVRTQREFLVRAHPWIDFMIIAAAEWLTCIAAGWWLCWRLLMPSPIELFMLSFGAATLARYVLRKELMQDIRGLRSELPREREAVSVEKSKVGK